MGNNQEIIQAKAEIFDILVEQEKCQLEIQRLEKIKAEKVQKLNELSKAQNGPV